MRCDSVEVREYMWLEVWVLTAVIVTEEYLGCDTRCVLLEIY
jgi:hypothetical protein